MFNSISPYIKYLSSTGVKWNYYNYSTLRKAFNENKIIFIHFGGLLNVEEREKCYKLFCNKSISTCLNENFIPIAIDSEDIPETTIVGLDLLLMNENKIETYLNVLTLPNGQPFTSFSSLEEEECLYLLRNAISAFRNKKSILEKAAEYMTLRLRNSGVVLQKKPIGKINSKILHTYVKHWQLSIFKNHKTPDQEYAIKPRFIVFLLKYAIRYNDIKLLEEIKERALEVVYSPIFDPVDGGIFLRATTYSLSKPMFEKNLSENAQSAVLFTFLYKQFKLPIFKYASERIVDFIEYRLKDSKNGYYYGITIRRPDNFYSLYYQFSLIDIKNAFPDNWVHIASCIGMDVTLPDYELQLLHFTEDSMLLTSTEISKLRELRNSNSSELWFDKRIITAYNCLYSSSLYIISKHNYSRRDLYKKIAGNIIELILSKREKNSLNLHRYTYGQSSTHEYYDADLHDYSLLLNSLLLRYITCKKKEYYNEIHKYLSFIFINFYQSLNGMFYEASIESKFSIYKRESIIDYTRYSGNSVMARNLLVLYRITGNTQCIDAFKQQIANVIDELIGSGPFMTGWALQILNYLTDVPQKVKNCHHS